jgi:hypothetical protein
MAESVLKRNPQIQQAQSRDYTADGAMSGKDSEGGKLQKDGVLVPEEV